MSVEPFLQGLQRVVDAFLSSVGNGKLDSWEAFALMVIAFLVILFAALIVKSLIVRFGAIRFS